MPLEEFTVSHVTSAIHDTVSANRRPVMNDGNVPRSRILVNTVRRGKR